MKHLFLVLLLAALALLPGCHRSASLASGDDDAGTDTDADTDTDTDSETEEPLGSISGTVLVPSQALPVSGALVYVTQGEVEPIPDGTHCAECVDVEGLPWSLSNPDGSFQIADVPPGEWTLVTRKGQFQRQRTVLISGGVMDVTVPLSDTTLPAENSGDGLDQIPSYAVLLNEWDHPEDLLAKLGLAVVDSNGEMVSGTEHFGRYSDEVSDVSAIGDSSILFEDGDALFDYQMVFFPCICDHLDPGTVGPDKAQILRDWVEAGGDLYSTCWASKWVEAPFPERIDFAGDDVEYPIGSVSMYQPLAEVTDAGMRAWLSILWPELDLDFFITEEASVMIEGLGDSDFDSIAWLVDQNAYPGAPVSLSFEQACGQVLYSAFHVTTSQSSPDIRPQEAMMLYTILELGGLCIQGG